MSKITIEELLTILDSRFNKNMYRHPNIKWGDVLKKLNNNQEKLEILINMETTGGEPDVVKYIKDTNEYAFYDCSKETPSERRNLCYDKEALESRIKFPPKNSAIEMAKEIGIEILSEEEYKYLQKIEEFDLKTSSWLKTPEEIRNLGGAIFGDRRYNQVFIYHNGAESYYGVRGFRGSLRV